MDKDYAALLERQARERADLAKHLEETRSARAAARTRVEQDQQTPPRPTWAAPEHPSIDSIYSRHLHNLGIEDKRTMGVLGQRHGEDRAQFAALDERHAQQRAPYEKERGAQSRNAPPNTNNKEPTQVKEVNQEPLAHTTVEQGKQVGGQPQTLEAEQAHEKVTEQKAAVDRAAAQEIQDSLRRAREARERDDDERGRER